MKLKIILILLISVNIIKVKGQKLSLGIESGVSKNTIFGNPDSKKFSQIKPYYGFNIGIQSRIALYKILGIKTGLYYERKGIILNTPNVYSTINGQTSTLISEFQFNYITLPFLLSLKLKFNPKVGIYVSSGLYASYLTNAKTINPNHKDFGVNTAYYQTTSEYKKTDWGAVADLQFYTQIFDRLQLTCSSKYFYGLNNVSNNPIINNGTLQHKSLLLLLGINYTW